MEETRDSFMKGRRVNIKVILNDPKSKRALMVNVIKALEGHETTQEQAERAYDLIKKEKEG